MKIRSTKILAGRFGSDELAELDAHTLHAVLATAREEIPHASLVAYAFDREEKVFVFLTPRNTTKYRNLRNNPHVSLLIDTRRNSDSDYASAEAFTVLGKASVSGAGGRRQRLLACILRKHPQLAEFSREKTTALIAVEITACYKVTRFQEVYDYSGE